MDVLRYIAKVMKTRVVCSLHYGVHRVAPLFARMYQ